MDGADATAVADPGAGSPWRVRRAEPRDVPVMDAMVRELADYEKAPQLVEATPDDLHAALFGDGSGEPRVHAHVAEVCAGGAWELAGMAVWYVTYSTWTGRHGLWLEDLYVRPPARRLGIGRALLAALAAECTERGYRRLEWWVLDWNAPAQAVYRSIGAVPQDEWTVWRLDGEALAQLGCAAPEAERAPAPEAERAPAPGPARGPGRRMPGLPGVGTVGG